MDLHILGAVLCFAFQTAPPAHFAVASVKRNTSGYNGIGNKFGPDTVRWTNAPLETLIEATYHLKHYQVIGAPAWADSERWDIDAKSDGPYTSSEKSAMIEALLAERFQLKCHHETRELPIFRLEIAKGGPKLAAAAPQTPGHRWGTTAGQGLLDMRGADMPNLVFWLSSQLDQPIVDTTGLTGIYDLKLEWNQDDQPQGNAPPAASDLPIFLAMESELGLKLVAAKGPVEVLVIDHVERPSAN